MHDEPVLALRRSVEGAQPSPCEPRIEVSQSERMVTSVPRAKDRVRSRMSNVKDASELFELMAAE
jgi:hypothetical protein